MTDVNALDVCTVPVPLKEFFLARQPILGRDQRLVAFELLFRNAGATEAEILDDVSATAAVISHASQLGMEHVVGRQLAFVNVDAVVLSSDFVQFLPSDRVILEILETVEATPALIERLYELRQLGFKFALDDVIADSANVQQFLPLVDIIKIDIKGLPSGALPALAHKLKSTHTKLLAEKVETIEEFEHCMALGFDYFQGYYFSRPVILAGRKIAPSELTILQVLNLINAGADNSAIEQSVKREPMLSLNLLRLVNTPGAGTLTTINSVAQALMVLGRRQLQRWLQILLYAKPGKTLELTSPLLQMAIIRGKLLELMALQMRPADRLSSDIGFSVGMLSLMDTLFSMPMAEVLATLVVADEVRAALIEHAGSFGKMLTIVEMLEQAQLGPDMSERLRCLNLTAGQLHDIQIQAFEWMNELTS